MPLDTNDSVVIEVAITPLRWGVPAQSVEQMVAEANACIEAGAGIVHHHHDMRLDEPAARVLPRSPEPSQVIASTAAPGRLAARTSTP